MPAHITVVDEGNNHRIITQIRVRDADGQLQTVKRVRARNTSNVLQTVYLPLTATVSPSAVAAYGNTGAAANLTTGQVVAEPIGGFSLPFSYAWVQKTLSPYTWTISSPATAATDFTVTALPAGAANSVDFEVTITDALTGETAKATVTATANNGLPYNPAPPPPPPPPPPPVNIRFDLDPSDLRRQ